MCTYQYADGTEKRSPHHFKLGLKMFALHIWCVHHGMCHGGLDVFYMRLYCHRTHTFHLPNHDTMPRSSVSWRYAFSYAIQLKRTGRACWQHSHGGGSFYISVCCTTAWKGSAIAYEYLTVCDFVNIYMHDCIRIYTCTNLRRLKYPAMYGRHLLRRQLGHFLACNLHEVSDHPFSHIQNRSCRM